eukprot:Skav235127  [mRNA]  locus=scaffold3581:279199:281079:- [translate_table: standard]
MNSCLSHSKAATAAPISLQTSIMSEKEFRPEQGDLFIPSDMKKLFENGPPVFRDKTMPLIGPQGAGKTTLFNKLTGEQAATSCGLETCTRKTRTSPALVPAQGLMISDTPGIGSRHVSFDDSMEVRKALIVGNVTQILAVQNLPNNPRQAAIDTALAPIDKIMGCATFRLDADGLDVCARNKERTPWRTRVFLVLTHRDEFPLPRSEWPTYIAIMRRTYGWIGAVALVDKRVSTQWLYQNVVACAGLQPLCCTNHSIPLPEFFAKFPIDFNLTPAEKSNLGKYRLDFDLGMDSAKHVLEEVRRCREAGFSGSPFYAEKLGASLDCYIRFLDDLFEHTTLTALAEMYGCQKGELFEGTDEAVNQAKVEKWNAVKAELASLYQEKKREIQNLVFSLEHKSEMSNFEKMAYKSRRAYRRMATKMKHFSDVVGSDGEEQAAAGQSLLRKAFATQKVQQKRGCGRPIQWQTMPCLSQQELIGLELIPAAPQFEPNHMNLSLVREYGIGVEAVVAWVQRHGWGACSKYFEKNAIDIDTLQDLTEDELRKDFGFENVYWMRSLLKKRRELKVAMDLSIE